VKVMGTRALVSCATTRPNIPHQRVHHARVRISRKASMRFYVPEASHGERQPFESKLKLA
jgi:hypothetical protein